MSLSDVLGRIVFTVEGNEAPWAAPGEEALWYVDPNTEAKILNAITLMYSTPTGELLLESIVNQLDDIRIVENANVPMSADRSKNALNYNESTVENIIRINNKGDAFNYEEERDIFRTIVHEMIHLIKDISDLDESVLPQQKDQPANFTKPDTDYVGEVVRTTNQILTEIDVSEEHLRVSYVSGFSLGTPGTQQYADNVEYYTEQWGRLTNFTDGETIDNVVISPANLNRGLIGNIIDTTKVQKDPTRDLVLGSSEDEKIFTGKEDDYIYGGGGNDQIFAGENDDTLRGGGGNDTLFGGDGQDLLVGDKGDDLLVGSLKINDELEAQEMFTRPIEDDRVYFDDGVSDRLEGGEGFDTYVIGIAENVDNAFEKTNVNEEYSGSFSNFFDVVIYENGNGVQGFVKEISVGSYSHIDVIADSDGQGQIVVDTSDWRSVPGNNQIAAVDFARGFSNAQYIKAFGISNVYFLAGTGGFAGNSDGFVYYDKGKLYGFTTIDKFGQKFHAMTEDDEGQLVGFHVRFVIEEFKDGDFGINLGLPIQGSEASDSVDFSGGPAVEYSGNGGDDTATGSDFTDYLDGGIGNDLLNGGGGADTLTGGTGNDILNGNAGADILLGGEGDDTLYVDADDTQFSGDSGRDTLVYTGSNNFQYASTQGSFEVIKAGSGNNTIWGGSADNEFHGEDGNDVLQGGDGDDILIGGTGADTLQGQDGDDTIYADEHDIWFSGDEGLDTLIFTSDNNFEYALSQGSFEKIYAGAGNNKVWGNDANEEIYLEGGDDLAQGGKGNDILDGGAGADTLQGQEGNDTIYADSDDTWFSGDEGIDTLIYVSADNRQYALAQGSFEHARMGAGNNTVWGTADTNYIDGEAGDDVLFGYAGEDRLTGGIGNDTLHGGDDSDTFVFESGHNGHDVISDFAAGLGTEDVIEFETSVFASFAAVVAAATDDGTNTTITINGNTSVTLQNVLISDLNTDDFAFV